MIRQPSRKNLFCHKPYLSQVANPLVGETCRYVWIRPDAAMVEISSLDNRESNLGGELSESPWSRALYGAALVGVMFLAYFFLFWFLQSCVLGISEFEMMQSTTRVHGIPL